MIFPVGIAQVSFKYRSVIISKCWLSDVVLRTVPIYQWPKTLVAQQLRVDEAYSYAMFEIRLARMSGGISLPYVLLSAY